MKMTVNTIKNIKSAIENSSELGYPTVKLYDECGEFILRFEDTNNVTHSIYITDNLITLGYITDDGVYHWRSERKIAAFKNAFEMAFNLAISIKEQYRYVEEYVI